MRDLNVNIYGDINLILSDLASMAATEDVYAEEDEENYEEWIHEIKERYRGTQIKAAVKVNLEQLLFNWELGRDMVTRKSEEKWGRGIVEQLSLDLQNEFPKIKGFSARNLWNMKKMVCILCQ